MRGRDVRSACLTSVFDSARSSIQHAAFAGHVVVQGMSDGLVPLASWAVPYHRRDVACAALACYARVFGVCFDAVALAARAVRKLFPVGDVGLVVAWVGRDISIASSLFVAAVAVCVEPVF